MKPFLLIPFVASLSYSLVTAQQQPALLSDPPDGTEAPPIEIRATLKPAEVLDTTITRQGGRDIIVQHLALDPNDPVKPAVAADSIRPANAISLTSHDTEAPPTNLLLLSATVYPGPFTHLRWTHHFANGEAKEYSGWSNIDFNHISGITTFRASDGENHSFVMGIGNEENHGDLLTSSFPSNNPTFLPDQTNIPAEALVTITSLHKLYEAEGPRLPAAHSGRERARLAKEAENLANPPQPKNLIIRYRIAETPIPPQQDGGGK